MKSARGTVIKEISWGPDEKAYRPGQSIEGAYEDLKILEDAQVIVIDRSEPVETAVIARKENAMRKHGGIRR